MESLELRIFQQVAYAKSITKAAQNMGYVQSNITAHIKKLEMELDTTLLIRHQKGITLTQDGEKLLYQVEKILALLDETSQSFQMATRSLHIGTTQTIAGYILPKWLSEYQKQYPTSSISIHALQQDDLERQLVTSELDCIITNRTSDIANARQIFQCPEKLVLISSITYQNLDEIKSLPLIVNTISTCPYRETLLNYGNSFSKHPIKIIECDTVETMLKMVELGDGISLLPEHVIQDREGIKTFSIEELQTTSIHIWVRQNSDLSRYRALMEIIKHELQK